MLHQKDFIACKLTQVALENYELKVQNQKLWDTVNQQREVFYKAQEEIDEDREESDRLLNELETENSRLREILQISDKFHCIDIQQEIKDGLKLAESANAQQPSQYQMAAPVDVKQMVADAAAQIKK